MPLLDFLLIWRTVRHDEPHPLATQALNACAAMR